MGLIPTAAIPNSHLHMTRINQPVRRWEWPDWAAIWQHRSFLFLLTWREVQGNYQHSVLGLGWILLSPLLQTLIYTLVFGVFLKAPSGDLPFAIFALSGVTTWLFFSQTITDMSRSLLNQNALIQKLYFPRLVLPLTVLLTHLLDLIVMIFVLAVVSLWFGIVPTWRYLLLPGLLLILCLSVTGFGLWLAPMQVFYRDLRQVVPLVMRFWFFLSPIVYARYVVPEGTLKFIYALNPLVPLLDGMRWILLGYGEMHWASMLYLLGFALLLNITGLSYFERHARNAADLV